MTKYIFPLERKRLLLLKWISFCRARKMRENRKQIEEESTPMRCREKEFIARKWRKETTSILFSPAKDAGKRVTIKLMQKMERSADEGRRRECM